jgi:hypothetical protein
MTIRSHFLSFREYIREEWKKVSGTQMGSNEGGIHTDEHGERSYIKHYRNADQAKVEALAGKIYNHLGISTLNPEHQVINGKPSVITKYNDNLERMQPHEFEHLSPKQAGQVGRMYHAAVLTKNWDIVGLEHDNILRHGQTGDLHAIDTGGAFHFRAQGGPKEYGPDIAEHGSLRGRPGEPSTHVFGHTFKAHPHAEHEGLEAVRSLDDNKIRHEFENSGLSNWKELHTNFNERKKSLLAKYPR